MKKLTLLLSALMIAGVTFAHDGKSCCKKNEKCAKESACCKDKKNCTKACKDTKTTSTKTTGAASKKS